MYKIKNVVNENIGLSIKIILLAGLKHTESEPILGIPVQLSIKIILLAGLKQANIAAIVALDVTFN